MSERESGRGDTPLAEAVARVGDRWSLLLVEALLQGPRRFNDLIGGLPGIAPNVLSQRLRHLEREGVVVARPYSTKPPRVMYQLTGAGQELAGALRLLAHWGSHRSEESESPRHEACGTPVEARWYCPTCDRVVEEGEREELRFV